MLSNILLIAGLVLLAVKLGVTRMPFARSIGARLRELAKAIDGLVNVLLALIIGAYVIQLAILLLNR